MLYDSSQRLILIEAQKSTQCNSSAVMTILSNDEIATVWYAGSPLHLAASTGKLWNSLLHELDSFEIKTHS